MRRDLQRIKGGKAAGLDGISSSFLKACADQLGEVVQHIFSLSQTVVSVPTLRKTCCVVPVPESAHKKEPNEYKQVALKSNTVEE